MRHASLFAACLLVTFVVAADAQSPQGEPLQSAAYVSVFREVISAERLLRLAASYSCSPRKTCSKTISSCEEAVWLYENCSWGGALDRDKDGLPCENLC